jgi:PilZ domain
MPELLRSVVSRMRIYVKDRRRSPRLRVRLLFTISLLQKAKGNGVSPRDRQLKGHIRDLSFDGMGLNVPKIHLDGHHLAAEGSELEIKLELPGGPATMRVVPRRYERLDETELGCNYLVGVRIVHMEEDDRQRYLSFLTQARTGKF